MEEGPTALMGAQDRGNQGLVIAWVVRVLEVKHVPEVCQLEIFVLLDSVRKGILLNEVQVIHH
jgi:hypothetical protein